MSNEKREVYWAQNSQDAALAKGLLDSSGIEAFVVGGILEAAAPEIPALQASPRVWVAASDAERAKEILAEWVTARNAEPSSPRKPWVCASCGEDVDADFDICWKCQAERP